MIFITNRDYNENEYAKISLEKNNKVIEIQSFHISNLTPYDGWYLFEKNI